MKRLEKVKKEAEAKAYINPEIAEAHKNKGIELFKSGDFPGAIKEFDEGLRRDPLNTALYSNRSAAFIKLLEPAQALRDANKAIELDPKFVKAWARKGTSHQLLKEYHKAIDAFDKGLQIDPSSKECLEGRQKTVNLIQSTSHAGSGNDEERMRHAMADPEIQMIMRDPTIQQVLRDLQENPRAGQAALSDPSIMAKIQKLIAAGVLKMG
jgi:stress-induced-phosphoprotein 1